MEASTRVRRQALTSGDLPVDWWSSTTVSAVTDDELVKQLHGDLQTEYFRIVDIVDKFDNRLLTIKGWGVTLSLAGIGFGFEKGHYGHGFGHCITRRCSQ
jgi:hypothetical protein